MSTLEQDLQEVLEQTGTLWPELKGARLFLTGGTGFIGCWLLESVCHANRKLGLGAKVTVLTRDPEAFRQKAPHLAGDSSIELLRGDVLKLPGVPGEYSHVIHAAGDISAHLLKTDPLKAFDTILIGTRNVLDWASGKSVSRTLFISSGAVYGRQPPELKGVPDDWPGAPDCTNPNAAYAEGKRAAEHLCSLFSRQARLPVSIARCFAFAGPYLPLDAHFALGNLIRDALAGGPIVVLGDGTPIRSYQYTSDLTTWLWHLLLRGEAGVPVNVGSEEAISIAELAQHISSVAGGVAVEVRGTPDPTRLPERYIPETARAQAMGLQNRVNLEQAILRTIQWNRCH